MTRRQVRLSAFILVVCVIKLCEVVFAIEKWPLTHVGMFAERMPPEEVPWRFRLEGFRDGHWFEIRPWFLAITPDAMKVRLGSTLEGLEERCGRLATTYDERRPEGRHLRRARVLAHRMARPGVPGQEPLDREVACPLGASLAVAP